jgi:hypothetical protein
MTPQQTQYTRKLKMYVFILPPSLSPIAIQCTETQTELVTVVSAPNTTTTTNSRQSCYYVPYENCLVSVLNSMNTYKSTEHIRVTNNLQCARTSCYKVYPPKAEINARHSCIDASSREVYRRKD